jgi:CBS domain containing-hemolysin-like protein
LTHLILILVSILFSAFFSGMEIAFVSANKLRIEIDKKQKKFLSGVVSFFTKHPSRFIASMLVGNNIALVIYGLSFAAMLEEPLRTSLGTESNALVLLVQTVISTLIILLTAEFLPKTLFRINPNNSLRILSIPILVFYILLFPLTLITIGISNFTMRYLLRVRPDQDQNEAVFSKVDLDHFLAQEHPEPESQGEELKEEVRIFKNALEFSKLKVRDCMIPRTEIIAHEDRVSVAELAQSFAVSGLSRIPILQGIH